MSYETGTATTPQDLIQNKLATFAAAEGWTITALADGGRMFEKGAIFIAFFWDTDSIFMSGATGVNAGADYDAQPGTGQICHTNYVEGAYAAYHIFGGADFLHVAIQIDASEYSHFHIGELDKVGAWSGGAYYMGTTWDDNSSYRNYSNRQQHIVPWDSIRANEPSGGGILQSGLWLRHRQSEEALGTVRDEGAFNYAINGVMFDSTPNTFNQLTPLIPIIAMLKQGDGLKAIGGTVKEIRYINMTNHQPGDVIVIAGDDWIVFPIKRRNDEAEVSGGVRASGLQGFAYKRVP